MVVSEKPEKSETSEISENSSRPGKFKKILASEWLQVPVFCAGSVCSGFLLSLGTISGGTSPLAAALAGICNPLYAFCMLLGSLLAYAIRQAPEEMQFVLIALVSVTCMRILFYEHHPNSDSDSNSYQKASVMGVLTGISCVISGLLLSLVFEHHTGKLLLYLPEAFLTGAAAYFLADAVQSLRENRKIILNPGKSFTFAICYLLGITALCGMDFQFCNLGRITGVLCTLLAARQFKQSAGTLCGALTTCGIVLCSVPLGMPLLFLPVTAMLAGFLSRTPNSVLIPAFFLMQIFSSAVLDSSMELVKILVELMIACCIYAMCSKIELRYFISIPAVNSIGQRQIIQQEQFLGDALEHLREETSAVMRHLTVGSIPDPIGQVREHVCKDCPQYQTCWKVNAAQQQALQQLLHTPSIMPEILEHCVNFKKLSESMMTASQKHALQQMQKVQLLQTRAMTLEYLRLLESLTGDSARRRECKFCEAETVSLKTLLRSCAISEDACFIYQLKSRRYAVEIYTKQENFPAETIRDILEQQFHVLFDLIPVQGKSCFKYCYVQQAPCRMNSAVRSLNAPAYERCGDHADTFTDPAGNQYLVISDGMGSGSTASLASRIAVKTFRNMILCGMSPESAIQLVNTMLMSETNTENFATLDILVLHADSNELTFYKSGAAATLFYHNNLNSTPNLNHPIEIISSRSFPVGMIPDAVPSREKRTACHGDQVIMLSDGIHEAEYPYMKQLLNRHLSPEEILQEIFEKASIFHGGEVRDDMTVIVAQVIYQNQNQNYVKHHSRNHSKNHSGTVPRNMTGTGEEIRQDLTTNTRN
ncbi:MAG: SpoIIE family protein phosphatase [Oscillospiraceae bacterium]|nr:SpoIIE family protein phosphatase [Oscillospiraceae bacterium]